MPRQVDVKRMKEQCGKLGTAGQNYVLMYMTGVMEFWLKSENERRKAEFFFRQLEGALASYEEREKEKAAKAAV